MTVVDAAQRLLTVGMSVQVFQKGRKNQPIGEVTAIQDIGNRTVIHLKPTPGSRVFKAFFTVYFRDEKPDELIFVGDELHGARHGTSNSGCYLRLV